MKALQPHQRSERSIRSWLTRAVPISLVAVLLILLPLILNGYWISLISLGLVYSVAAGGFNIILGWAGQLAFTGAMYFGMGAFVTGFAISKLVIWAEPALLVGILGGAALGAITGLLVMRLKRYYLAIATLALMFLLDYFYTNTPDVTGGVSGFLVPSPYFILLAGGQVNDVVARYYVSAIVALIAFAFLSYLRSSQLARGWRTLRVSEPAAQAVGIRVYRSKVYASVFSGGVMGFAGGWFVVLVGIFLPSSYRLEELLFLFLILVVGGLGSVRGVALSAIILVITREYLRGFIGLSELLFGLMLLVIVLFFQRGIYGTLAAKFSRLREPVA